MFAELRSLLLVLFNASVVAPSGSSLPISTIERLPRSEDDTSMSLFKLCILDKFPIIAFSFTMGFSYFSAYDFFLGVSLTPGVKCLTSSTFGQPDRSEAGDCDFRSCMVESCPVAFFRTSLY